jgi:hypothetical protein
MVVAGPAGSVLCGNPAGLITILYCLNDKTSYKQLIRTAEKRPLSTSIHCCVHKLLDDGSGIFACSGSIATAASLPFLFCPQGLVSQYAFIREILGRPNCLL